MKKLLLIFAFISISFIGCTGVSSETVTTVKTNDTVTSVKCDTLRIITDAVRAKHLMEIIKKKQKHDGVTFHVDTIMVKNYTVPYQGKQVKGFTINGVDVAYSDKILGEAQAFMGYNSDVPKAQLLPSLEQLFCDKQFNAFMSEYSRIQKSCETIKVINHHEDSHEETSWWKNVPAWEWFGILWLLFLLLWLLWSWLRRKRDRKNHQETSSKTTSVSDDKFKQGIDAVIKIVEGGNEAKFDYRDNDVTCILSGRPSRQNSKDKK